ncbi:alpha/beta hydrolase [Pseudonocardia sp. MCCB 268]|nr:alpha/beta hydrolase [Pseudonocardia cytotoxica]
MGRHCGPLLGPPPPDRSGAGVPAWGGWVLGAPSTHRRLARDIAGWPGGIVVDYRRSAAPVPAAVDDTTDAIEWARRHASTWEGT